MIQEMAARIVEGSLLIGASIGLVSILLASLYDLLLIARRSRLRAAVVKLRKPRQPPVTLLVYAHNDAATIEACLRAIKRSYYHNYDIVVIDDVSRDATRQIIRRFMRKHPQLPLRLYAKRKAGSVRGALWQGYQRSQKGELVMTLTADSCPSRSLLKAAVARFEMNAKLTGITMNECPQAPATIATVGAEFIRLSRHMFAKNLSLGGVRYGRPGLNGMYRKSLYATRQTKAKIRYEGSLVLPVARTRQYFTQQRTVPLRIAKALLLIVLLSLMTYSMYVAARLFSSMPLIVGWTIIAAWGIAAVWSDEGLRLARRIELVFSTPVLYFLAYAGLAKSVLDMSLRLLAFPLKVTRPALGWRIHRQALS